MIEIWAYRQKNGPEILLQSRYASIEEAVESLLKYELGYGGQITELSGEKIEIVTHILGCKDRTVYAGTKEDMKDLVLTACLWLRADREVSFDEWWQRVSKMSDGVPLLVAASSGIIRGDLVKEKLAKQLQESA